jgi:dihydrofolate reductase
MGGPGAMLFGRRTYEHFFTVWPGRTDNPYSAALDNAQKHVASTTLAEPLPWRNSTLISGDVPGRVRELKRELDGTITVLGSGRLIHTLIEHDLIDRYVLPIMPVALGAGGRLFPADRRVPLELIDSLVTTTGVTINTYRPARP